MKNIKVIINLILKYSHFFIRILKLSHININPKIVECIKNWSYTQTKIITENIFGM